MSNVPRAAFQRQIIALIPVFMNTLMIGGSSAWFTNALYYLVLGEEVRATTSECTLILSLTEIAKIVFAIPAGVIVDKYGNKITTVGASFLDVLVWSLLSLGTSVNTIYVARFINGITQALKYATSLMMIGEIASPEIRGNLASIYQISMNMGQIVPSVISLLFGSYKWLTWSVALLSVTTMLTMFWATETPNYLISISKLKQAKCNLQRIRQGYPESEINDEFEKLKNYIEDEKTRKSQTKWITFLTSKSIRKPLLVGTLTNFLVVATGSLLIRSYVTTLIPANDIVPTTSYPLVYQIFTLLGATATAFYVEHVSRRTIFLLGAATTTVSSAFCALSHYFITQNVNDQVFRWLFILGNFFILMCYSNTLQAMINTLNCELYPQALKGFCGSLVIINQAISFTVLIQLYSIITEHFHLYLLYVIFSISSITLFLVIYFLLPEGRGEFLTDLQSKFKEDTSPCEGAKVEEKNSSEMK